MTDATTDQPDSSDESDLAADAPDTAAPEIDPDHDAPAVCTLDDMLAAVSPTGLTVLHCTDPEAAALELSESLGAELATPGPELRAAVKARLELLKAAGDARQRLAELEATSAVRPRAKKVVIDTDGLRKLVVSLERAERLVSSSATEVRHRLSTRAAGELAVHPDTIRRAADECNEARARLAAAERALREAEADYEAQRAAAEGEAAHDAEPWPDHVDDLSGADAFGAEGDAEAQQRMNQSSGAPGPFGDVTRSALSRVALIFAGCVLLSLLLVLVIGLPVVFAVVLPALALGWGASELRDHRRDAEDRDMALDNLASVSAITEQAYGGIDLIDDELDTVLVEEPQALVHARARHASAGNQVARTTADFEALVGPGADPDDLDSILRVRDAQFEVTDQQIAVTPTVRAASGFHRRLHAEWKVAWAAVGMEPPALADAEAEISRLEARNVHVVTVEKWQENGDADAGESGGDMVDELQRVIDEKPTPIVVYGEGARIDIDRVRTASEPIADAVAVVVVR